LRGAKPERTVSPLPEADGDKERRNPKRHLTFFGFSF
jgi:hypothetical protein